MDYKKIIPFINAEAEMDESVLEKATYYARHGADELFLYNYSKEEACHEQFIKLVKQVVATIDIPVIIGLYVARFEDIKKALYTGAKQVVVKRKIIPDEMEVKEGTKRFGADKVIIEVEDFHEALEPSFIGWMEDMGIYGVLLKHLTLTERLEKQISGLKFPVYIRDSLTRNDMADLLSIPSVLGVSTNHYLEKNILKVKQQLKNNGIYVNTFDSSLKWEDFKLNSDGMIPVIAQHYKTGEVLMLAYMNKEAFEQTVLEGVMTYYSRSRNELWVKGKTSGNYQYVKALTIDCDNDTILAKVEPLGPACHTGNKTCFFTDLVKKEYDEMNPLTVLEDVYGIIMDRKQHPKEGSYTNYLFDKGIDKILKKCGEEATEIVIAAKNPDAEELKYEISDFLYHMMVLMAECNLDWNDIIKELAHRR
ncbi:MAG: bifunctional phosphoribosyl-AMP cyclohydrolase/phosphoribosyl-ATP diphosphatase HisIE [bacterium]|nr:bifunctional phosphoribosyl-AMP cyclohydrolase/phosphoribosyl-ATP diphosphatase HisIE [bacterium]